MIADNRSIFDRAARRFGTPACILLLALGPVIWWWPMLRGLLPDFMDTVTYLYPMRVAIARILSTATLPIYLPNQFGGVPLMANPQLATFYPPQLFFYIWPTVLTFNILAVAHYIWAGWGTWRLSRAWGADRWAALFGAVTLQFSAMMISRMALLPHVYAAAWVPWIMWAVWKSSRPNAHGGWIAVAGIFSGLQFLSGAPQISYYTALSLPVLWFGWAWHRARMDGFDATQIRLHLRTKLWHLVPLGIVAGLVALPQLRATLRYMSETARGTLSMEKLQNTALNGEMLWRALVGGTMTGFEDTDTINAIGAGALLLFVVAVAAKRSRGFALPILAVGALMWLLAVGPLVSIWSQVLPMYGSFHAPRRALVLWSALGPAAAAAGAHVLVLWFRQRRLGWAAPLILVALTAGTWWMLPRLEREFTPESRYRIDSRAISAIGASRFITVDPTLNYAYDSRRKDFGQSLVPNSAAYHNLFDVQGYDPLFLESHATARGLANRDSGMFFPSHGVIFTNPNSPVLDLLGVECIVGRTDLFDPGRVIPGARFNAVALDAATTITFDHEGWPVRRFTTSRPLAWGPKTFTFASSVSAASFAALAPQPRAHATVETMQEDMPVPAKFARAVVRRAVWADARTLEVDIAAIEGEGPALVVTSVPYTKRFRSYDAMRYRLANYRAYGFLCAFEVKAPGVVRMKYR